MVSQKELLRLKLTIGFVNSLLEYHERIIDVGSGTGVIAKELNSNFVVGVDSDLNNVRRNKLEFKILAVASDLPFKDNSFDVAIFTEVLEHVSRPEKVIRELYRVSDRMILSTPNNCLPRRILWKVRRKTTLSSRYHIREYSWSEVKRMIESVGYRLKRFTGIGFVVNKPMLLAYRLGKLFPRWGSKMLMEYRKVPTKNPT